MITKVLLILWILIIIFYFETGEGKVETSCHHLMVYHADNGHCNGEYALSNISVSWAPDKPVYKHLGKDRVIYWNARGYGWSIGATAFLASGTYWYKSGLDSDEPWQGEWENNVTVNCIKGIVQERETTIKVNDLDDDNFFGSGAINFKQSLIVGYFPLLYLTQCVKDV